MISTVSILGSDDSVSPIDLVEISHLYPFVEWGINLSPNVKPTVSYPSEEWLEELSFHADKLRLRGVLQGQWECDILSGILSLKSSNPKLWEMFQRIEFSIVNGYNHLLIEALQLIPDKEIILRVQNPTQFFMININAHPLYKYNYNLEYTHYCGYSITEDEIVSVMNKKNKHSNFWISVDGFREYNKTLNLFMIEDFLDRVEDEINDDLIFKSLLETKSFKKRLSDPKAVTY